MHDEHARCEQETAEQLRFLRAEIRRETLRIEAQRREYRGLCAERMRRWLILGRLPQDLLRQMRRETRTHVQGLPPDQAAALMVMLNQGIAEARSESKLIFSPA